MGSCFLICHTLEIWNKHKARLGSFWMKTSQDFSKWSHFLTDHKKPHWFLHVITDMRLRNITNWRHLCHCQNQNNTSLWCHSLYAQLKRAETTTNKTAEMFVKKSSLTLSFNSNQDLLKCFSCSCSNILWLKRSDG